MSAPRDYEAEARDHPAHSYAYAFDYVMHEYMLRTLQRHVVGTDALELGCYHGNFTRLLVDRFSTLEVVEASAECIEIAAAKVPAHVRFHQSTFEQFAPPRLYANIFLVHTLEHLDERASMLARIGSWLQPGGRLFVVTPNARAGSRQIAVAMGLIPHAAAITSAEAAHGHRVTYSFDTLALDIVSAGLVAESKGGVFFKGLANFQLDKALAAGIISREYLDGCYLLGEQYPDLCSSIYFVCSVGRPVA